jgi:hypothetical protein
MGEEADRIKKHIEAKRYDLSAHLNELEYRVKNAADWRAQVMRRPAAAAAVAFIGGLLLALILPAGR